MSGITTNTGLVSGLPIQDIIDQLMQVEARPRQLVQRQNQQLQNKQSAYQDVNAKLLALKSAASDLTADRAFKGTTASSSNESVLTASSDIGAPAGNYNFTVKQLVSAQQTLTKGFADATDTAVGPGTLSFDRGGARLEQDTKLAQLNAGEGVDRGRIRITDRSGATATVDLSTAITVDDVTKAINAATGVNVTASVDGDGLTLTDNSGQTASNLTVENVGTHSTATTLGLADSVAANTLTGSQINTIGDNSLLNDLNDGNGVSVRQGAADFRLATANGSTYDIDLTDNATIGDVIDNINTTTGGDVTAAVAPDGVSLQLTDNTSGGTTFAVTALNDSQAGADLGLIGSDGDADGVLSGQRMRAQLNSKLTRFLNGGSGVNLGTISITDRSGASDNVDLSGATSVNQIIGAINDSAANVTAALNSSGNGITITDNTGGSNDLVISDVSGTGAADLNIDGNHSADSVNTGNMQLQYLTKASRLDNLNVTRGEFRITDSSGATATVDLTQGNETTIGDVISEINSRGLQLNARINDTGDGILIEDTGPGSVKMKVEEQGSTTAADLGLLGEAANAGDDLDGSLEKTITLEATDTLNDVVTKINDANVGVNAAVINDGSSGAPHRLLLSSENGGTDGAFVFDDGALDFGASTLSEAQDAAVFFGSADPANALAISSDSNTLDSVIPSTEINLKATTNSPVQVTVSEDHETIVKDVSNFTKKFNGFIDTVNKYDTYNQETNERGPLLGDPTVSSVKRAIYNKINGRDSDLTGQFQSLAEIGITVGNGGKLSVDETKLRSALDTDLSSVKSLFTFKQTEEDEVSGEQQITAAGIGVEIDELLKRLTDTQTGSVQARIDSIDDRISLNEDRIENINEQLQAKREQLQAEFIAMEQSIAEIQRQQQSLSGIRSIGGGGGGSSALQQLQSLG